MNVRPKAYCPKPAHIQYKTTVKNTAVDIHTHTLTLRWQLFPHRAINITYTLMQFTQQTSDFKKNMPLRPNGS